MESEGFYIIQVRQGAFDFWDNQSGVAIEEVLNSDLWYIDRESNSLGLRRNELGVIEFDRIFGSLTAFQTLKILPDQIINAEVVQYERNFKGLKKFIGEFVGSFSPNKAAVMLKHIYACNRIRFEALILIIVDVINRQEISLRETVKTSTVKRNDIYEVAYRDLFNRCPKELRDEHIQLNPGFLKILPESAECVQGTTMN